MSDASRLVILHNHLFKNAGTTIDWSLGRELGSAFVDHRDDAGMQQGARYLEGYLRDNPAMAGLSTHHLTFPLPEIVGVRLAVLTMFRHPIERVTSVYAFERKQVTSRNPGPVKAREATLADYIEWRLEPLVGPTIRNFHVIKCLPPRALPLDPPDSSEFAQALAFARSVDLLGIVERFDESMVLFEEALRPHFPRIDLSYVAQNVGQSAALSGAQRIAELREAIGDALFARLEAVNAPDLALYAAVVDEFDRRFAALPQGADRLAEFRVRCERRRNAEG